MKLSNLKAAIIAAVFMVLVSFQGGQQQPKTITITAVAAYLFVIDG